jgi:multidrug efflux pump subunit AcrB
MSKISIIVLIPIGFLWSIFFLLGLPFWLTIVTAIATGFLISILLFETIGKKLAKKHEERINKLTRDMLDDNDLFV